MIESDQETRKDEGIDRRTMLKGTAVAGIIGVTLTGTTSVHANTQGNDDDGGRLPKEVIVSLPGSDEYTEYTFEVTGDLRKLEPDEDAGRARDDVTDLGDRVRMEGTVRTGDDRFAFSGDLIEIDVPPEVKIEIRDRSDRTDTSKATVLEDWADGVWPGDWTRETHGYTITNNALVGSFAIEANGSLGYPDVRKPTVDTPRERTYTVRTVPDSSGAYPTLLTNCQQRDVMADCYAAWLRTGLDELLLEVRSGGSGTTLETVTTSQPLSANTEYTIALDVGSDWVQARVATSDGTELAATGQQTDTAHSGGTPGLYTGGTSEAVSGTRYDQYTRRPLGSL